MDGKKIIAKVFPIQRRADDVEKVQRHNNNNKNTHGKKEYCVRLVVAGDADTDAAAADFFPPMCVYFTSFVYYANFMYMYVWPRICVLFCIGMEYRLAINETRNLTSETNKIADKRWNIHTTLKIPEWMVDTEYNGKKKRSKYRAGFQQQQHQPAYTIYEHTTQQRTHHTEILMPIQYMKYNFGPFLFNASRCSSHQSRCFSVIVDTRNRHQPRDAGNNFLIFIF